METLSFDLKMMRKPVMLKDENGKDTEYVLQEITGKDRDEYLTFMAGQKRYDNGQEAGWKSFANVQARLIHLCLFTPDMKNVDIAKIQMWPARVQNGLYEAASKLSGLDKEAEVAAKNG